MPQAVTRLQKSRSLNQQLATLILGLVLPTLGFIGVLLWQLSGSERSRIEEETQATARGFSVAVDREINGVLTTLQALATSPSLQSRDFSGFYKQASEVARLQGINISLRDFAGHAVLTTRAPFGSDVGVPPVLAETDQMVLRSGAPMVSNIFTSTIAGRPVFQIMTAPVLVAGTPTFVLGASIDVEYLAEAIRKEHMPQGWIGAIIDRNSVFVARTERHDELAGRQASSDFRTKAVGDSGMYYGTNSVGQGVLVGYAKSSLTGWISTAGLPTDFLTASFRKSFVALLILGLVLTAIEILIAFVISRRIARAFNSLGEAAQAIGQGRAIQPGDTPIADVNRVWSVLSAADQQLRVRAEERDRAETALRSLNEKLEQKVDEQTRERNRLWETSKDLVASCAIGGEILAANPAWDAVLGWTQQELLAKPVTDFVAESDRASFELLMRSLDGEQSKNAISVQMKCRNGNLRTIMFSVATEVDKSIFYLVGRDMTDQRLMEDALRQSQKMDALGQMTGGIAHDFNNMLAIIIGTLDLLRRRLDRGDRNVEKYVESALDGAKRAATLTQRLLAFARQQPLSPQSIDANRLIAGMADLLNRTLGETNRIETVLAAGLWQAVVDPSQLENVILNLAVNARDAMPHGGKLTLETANAHVDDAYARDHAIAPGQYVMLAVSDTGCGMSPDVVAKAFDPFFTTKAVGQGTGLGLSQVFGVARQSGGHVKIYSEVGHGTTIKLYLPRAYGAAQSVAAKKMPERVKSGDVTETIMVVEDEDRVRDFAVEALRDLGYSVVPAAGGLEALHLLGTDQEIDLLFTDIIMPDLTGRQLVDAIREKRPQLKVLYMTGYSRNAIVHNGVLDPGTNLLAKPFTMDQLADSVRRVLDS